MIRGVNKQVIEVLNTENEYFEKAILIVSERYVECNRAKFDRKANEYVAGIVPFSESYEKRKEKMPGKIKKTLFEAAKYLAFSGAGAAIVYFIVR
ncbi:MAG: hypothetical protein IJ027_08365 [Oscillospiraceae bacterium]|nr:hypothetical protein [Oscillospiraceae bacterium]